MVVESTKAFICLQQVRRNACHLALSSEQIYFQNLSMLTIWMQIATSSMAA
jgi:hypothetical protein